MQQIFPCSAKYLLKGGKNFSNQTIEFIQQFLESLKTSKKRKKSSKNLVKFRSYQSLRITTQRILQQSRQFRVPIWHMFRFTIDQSGNDISQSRQRQIDFRRLFHSFTCRAGFIGPFRSSQVHQVQLSLSYHSIVIVALVFRSFRDLFDVDYENTVRSWTAGFKW